MLKTNNPAIPDRDAFLFEERNLLRSAVRKPAYASVALHYPVAGHARKSRTVKRYLQRFLRRCRAEESVRVAVQRISHSAVCL